MPDAPSVFQSETGRLAGIYLWTIPLPEGHMIYYVGETGRSFRDRLFEHYREHASCFYHLHSPAEFARGEKRPIWPGRYDPTDRKSVVECIEQYPRLAPYVAELTTLYRFYLAPFPYDARLRRRVEAAIALHLYRSPGSIGAFQERGIRYSPKYPDEEGIVANIRSSVPLLGLPDSLLA
jgi:hypothetical protein